MPVEVGVRELRENLAEWLDRAQAGEDILVTERGRPKARLSVPETPWERLVREGVITPPGGKPRPLPSPVAIDGSIMPFLQWARGKGAWPGSPETDPDREPDQE